MGWRAINTNLYDELDTDKASSHAQLEFNAFLKRKDMQMYKRILIATDGSPLSNKAVQSGLQLACLTGAQIFALKIVPRYPVSYFEGGMAMPMDEVAKVEKQWAQQAQAIVENIKTEAQEQGLKAKALIKSSDLIAESIIGTAKKHKCDLIVMASHGRRGLKRILMGSETTHVLTHSHVPVLVLR